MKKNCETGRWQLVCIISPSNAEATFDQSTRTQKIFENNLKPCHVGIHWIALTEYSMMSTHVLGFQTFSDFFLHHFVLAKLTTSSKRVKENSIVSY